MLICIYLRGKTFKECYFCAENVAIVWRIQSNPVNLHCVFHSIRFKVNISFGVRRYSIFFCYLRNFRYSFHANSAPSSIPAPVLIRAWTRCPLFTGAGFAKSCRRNLLIFSLSFLISRNNCNLRSSIDRNVVYVGCGLFSSFIVIVFWVKRILNRERHGCISIHLFCLLHQQACQKLHKWFLHPVFPEGKEEQEQDYIEGGHDAERKGIARKRCYRVGRGKR